MDDDRHVKNGNYLKKCNLYKMQTTRLKGKIYTFQIFGPPATTDESLTPKPEAVTDHKHGYKCFM